MQRWWIAVVAVVGVVLAFLLFPRLDTGAEIPDPDPSNVDPLDFVGDPAGTVRPPGAKTGKSRRGTNGQKPGMERLIQLRSQPDAVFAGKLIAPWSAIRYTLMKVNDPEATVIADDIRTEMAKLQRGRRDPTEAPPFADTEQNLRSLEARVKASRWADDETIVLALKRHEVALDEYNATLEEGDGTPDAEEAP